MPLYRACEEARTALDIWKQGLYPPGHYYSPLVSIESIPDVMTIDYNVAIPGVDLNEGSQLSLLDNLKAYYKKDLFPVRKKDGWRYYFDNLYFSYSDGIFLSALMQHYKPKRIIEVGSGWSSAVMLDTNEKFLNDACRLTFIEPFPEERLKVLVPQLNADILVQDFVQSVNTDFFKQLSTGDILFIDSSHVSKFRSDLNYLLFHVLPALNSGVIIHFHDIMFPFEYPPEWLKQGRSWNEAYLLRAFLQHNSSYEILLFTSYLEGKHSEWFRENMPLCLKKHELILLEDKQYLMDTTGQSLYIQKK